MDIRSYTSNSLISTYKKQRVWIKGEIRATPNLSTYLSGLESVYTHDGTHHIHTLTVAGNINEHNGFAPGIK